MSKNNQVDEIDKLFAKITESCLEEARELISQVETELLYDKNPHDQDDFLKKTTKELIRNIKSLSFKIANAKNECGHNLKPKLFFEMGEKLRKLALLHAPITNGTNGN